MSLEPCSQIAGAARDRALSFEARRGVPRRGPVCCGFFCAVRGTISAIGVSRSYTMTEPPAGLIEIRERPFRSSAILAFFMMPIIASWRCWATQSLKRRGGSAREEFAEGARFEADADVEGAELRVRRAGLIEAHLVDEFVTRSDRRRKDRRPIPNRRIRSSPK